MINMNESNTIISKLNPYDLSELLKIIENEQLTLRSRLNLLKTMTFGMEIEYQKLSMHEVIQFLNIINQKYARIDRWVIKWDHTVCYRKEIDGVKRIFGGEINSRILTDSSNVWPELKIICDMLQSNGAITGNVSGGHIHYGRNLFESNPKYLMNFIKFWIIYEKIIFRFSYGDNLGPRKSILEAACPLSTTLYEQIKKYSKVDDYDKLLKIIPQEKKNAINFHVRKEENPKETIEFRCPNGTLNPIIWQNNVNFFGKMLMWCASDKFDENFINYKLKHYKINDYEWPLYNEIYLQEVLELCDLIFDNNFDKIYFLKQYLKSFQQPYTEEENMKRIKLCV